MFHVEHKHIFKMWKWTPHVVHAFNGGFIMTPKEKAKKAPTKKELLNDIITLDDRFDRISLVRMNIANLALLKSVLG